MRILKLNFYFSINLRLPPEAVAPVAAVVVAAVEPVPVPHVLEDALDELVTVRFAATISLRNRLGQRRIMAKKDKILFNLIHFCQFLQTNWCQ